ncbi:MAG: hypothetical protein RLZZ339_1751 [Cyanobacteriota bacterium]|jgi:choice-of-anchor C domain-containing protein
MNLLIMTQQLAKLTNLGGLAKHGLLKLSIASSVFAVGALIVTPVQAVELITNGSFENGVPIPPGDLTTTPIGGFLSLFSGDSTSITGWTVGGNSTPAVDYISTLWDAADGVRSIDLNGAGTGSISQVINTEIGKTYRVTFDLAGNPTAPPDTKLMQVSAAGAFQDFSFDITGKSTTNMGWVSKSWDFTATGTTTTLQFSGINSGAAGAALDNVSVMLSSTPPTPTSIPEPSSILGLLSLGVLGIGSALKRQS